MIISAYRTEKTSEDHPYIWRYMGRRGSVISDHPYNGEYLLVSQRLRGSSSAPRSTIPACFSELTSGG